MTDPTVQHPPVAGAAETPPIQAGPRWHCRPATRFVESTVTTRGMKIIALLPVTCLLALAAAPASAAGVRSLAVEGDVIGELRYDHARRADTLMDIARWERMGYHEIRRANPGIDLWLPGEGTRVLIPSRFVLPDAPREGIVINLAELRLYYYYDDAGGRRVVTYPVGIGRQGLETPLGTTRVVARLDHPAWYPPPGAREEAARDGNPLPAVVPPGPDNPLGEHALVLELSGYLIHGTNRPDGVGMRVSRGCIRLYPEDIAELVRTVEIGTPVHIVDQPVKAGFDGNRLWLEVHRDGGGHRPALHQVHAAVGRVLARENAPAVMIDATAVTEVRDRSDGVAYDVTLAPGP